MNIEDNAGDFAGKFYLTALEEDIILRAIDYYLDNEIYTKDEHLRQIYNERFGIVEEYNEYAEATITRISLQLYEHVKENGG